MLIERDAVLRLLRDMKLENISSNDRNLIDEINKLPSSVLVCPGQLLYTTETYNGSTSTDLVYGVTVQFVNIKHDATGYFGVTYNDSDSIFSTFKFSDIGVKIFRSYEDALAAKEGQKC